MIIKFMAHQYDIFRYRLWDGPEPEYDLVSSLDNHQVRKILDWCFDNCQSNWIMYRRRIYFESAEDYTLFKLTFN